MKHTKFLFALLIAGALTSCSKDDNANPEIVNDGEVITTVKVVLKPANGGAEVVLQSQDLDGDGPNNPEISVSGKLSANTTYSGTTQFFNETVNPAEDITIEVKEENDDHQVFYTTSNGLNITVNYKDKDGNGNPVGLEYDLITGAASNGTLSLTLRHEPKKPNTGISDAGGETDLAVNFDVTIE